MAILGDCQLNYAKNDIHGQNLELINVLKVLNAVLNAVFYHGVESFRIYGW